MAGIYTHCMRNHSAANGTYTLDGCSEFIPDEASELRCSVCGCHRNFHRLLQPLPQQLPWVLALGVPHVQQEERARRRFTVEQRRRMTAFAERIGWSMPRRRRDQVEVERFLSEVRVSWRRFRVWMQNNRDAALAQVCDDSSTDTDDGSGPPTVSEAESSGVGNVE